MKKQFFRFVTSYGLFHQFILFVGVFFLYSIVYAVGLLCLVENDASHSLVEIIVAMTTAEVSQLGYSKVWQSLYLAGTSIIVLVWQSVLIMKFMTRPDYLQLSEVLTYYPLGYHNNSKDKHDYLVFRLMNDGYDDLYNVEIKVTYRFFHEESKTFQHYECSVKNETVPVLSPKMPFRIYINTGVMKNIRDLYLDPANIHEGEAGGLDRVIKKERPHDMFIVFVAGYDSQLNQTKSVFIHYKMKDLQYGEFVSIEPKDGVFSGDEIQSKFNRVNGGQWPGEDQCSVVKG